MKRLRDKLTYANVMATLAVFIALGGTSYAALTVTGRNVRNGSLTARDIKRNTLGGSRVKESRLGTVPRAGNALRLNGVTAERLLVRCPEGTLPSVATCVEVAARSPRPYGSAALDCRTTDSRSTPGRRLPTHQELLGAQDYQQITLAPGGELTAEVYPGDPLNVLVMVEETGASGVTTDTFAGAKPFRCVADPLN